MILVFVEHAEGRPDRLSVEAIAFARRFAAPAGGPVHAILVGEGAAAAAAALTGQGVAVAHAVEDPRLAVYAPAGWAAALGGIVGSTHPDIVVGPGSDRGAEVLAYLAARMDLPMAANCIDAVAGDPFRVTRQRWGGSLIEEATLAGPVRLMTVAAHAFLPETAAGPAPAIETVAPSVTETDLRVRVVGQEPAEADSVSLGDAKVVVGGGRGLGSGEAFAILDELAGLIGAAVGVSRVATSAGWRPHAQQIGQTGQRIAPDLYIACGISGAIQHIVGCKAAKQILVINSDPEAPILKRASYAVIGDLHAIVPAISAEIRRVRAGGA
jgi:electron transfer flavoprotein alpha subunit